MTDDRVMLSAPARRSLEERLAQLHEERIPRLEREFASTHDPLAETALRDARDEAARVRHALETAEPLEAEPHDPTIVELGDTVTVRREGRATKERFTIVGELEARMDDTWVSTRAPLGAALLDSSVGQVVTVSTPEGEQRYEVLAIERQG
jgi:transcription elongation factor GreA